MVYKIGGCNVGGDWDGDKDGDKDGVGLESVSTPCPRTCSISKTTSCICVFNFCNFNTVLYVPVSFLICTFCLKECGLVGMVKNLPRNLPHKNPITIVEKRIGILMWTVNIIDDR